MQAKYLTRVMNASTREEINRVMSTETFMTSEEIATRAGKSVRGMEQKLRRLLDKGCIERQKDPVPSGGFRFLWRLLPAGYVAPLYDAQPGIDARALDECLGGHTYVKHVLENRSHE